MKINNNIVLLQRNLQPKQKVNNAFALLSRNQASCWYMLWFDPDSFKFNCEIHFHIFRIKGIQTRLVTIINFNQTSPVLLKSHTSSRTISFGPDNIWYLIDSDMRSAECIPILTHLPHANNHIPAPVWFNRATRTNLQPQRFKWTKKQLPTYYLLFHITRKILIPSYNVLFSFLFLFWTFAFSHADLMGTKRLERLVDTADACRSACLENTAPGINAAVITLHPPVGHSKGMRWSLSENKH